MSGVGEAVLVLGQISSALTIFETIHEVYDANSDAQALPRKFRVAVEQIPLVHNMLNLAKQNIDQKLVSEEVLKSVKPVLERCRENAAIVQEILNKTMPTTDDSRAERMRKAMGLTKKSNKLRDDMEDILTSTKFLAQHEVLQDAEALKEVKDAIDALSNVRDDEAEPQFIQYILVLAGSTPTLGQAPRPTIIILEPGIC